MESFYIPILESLPLLSVIAPYFGSSDKCFIVLSKLSVCIRNNLINHYPEFRRFMLGYTKTLKIRMKELSKMMLPFDLFNFYICENHEASVFDDAETSNVVKVKHLITLLYTI